MAMLENGFLKLAATQTFGIAFPLGLVAVAAIWVWSARDRQSAPPPRGESSATGSKGDADADRSSREAAGSANPTLREHSSYRPGSAAWMSGGTDRGALLSQILEDNIRLREALK